MISTLHTNSAAGAIPRLIDLKAEPFLLISTLRVITGQRLVRQLCAAKEKYKLNSSNLDKLAEHINMDKVLASLKEEKVVGPKDSWPAISFYKPKPSVECEDGYSGRIGIHEVLYVSPAIERLILSEPSTTDIETEARKEGMMTMLEDGVFKAAQGITTLEEVFRVISE